MTPTMKNLIIVALALFIIVLGFMVWNKMKATEKSVTSAGSSTTTTTAQPTSGTDSNA